MATVIIDGHDIEIGDEERLNGIQAAQRARRRDSALLLASGAVGRGELPHVPGRDRHAATPRRARSRCSPSSCPPARRRPRTARCSSPTARRCSKPRAMVEEDLLIDHPIDCPICDKAGECLLQDYHFEHGQKERRADIKPFTSRRREMGDTVTLFVDRCVMCSRCVRFTPRDQRHQRADGHQPRQPRRDRRLPRLSAGQQAVGQRRRSVPGRRAGRQGLSLPAARLVHEAATTTSAPAARPAARSRSRRTRTTSTASSRARTRTSTSGGCATKAATASTTCTSEAAARSARIAAKEGTAGRRRMAPGPGRAA